MTRERLEGLVSQTSHQKAYPNPRLAEAGTLKQTVRFLAQGKDKLGPVAPSSHPMYPNRQVPPVAKAPLHWITKNTEASKESEGGELSGVIST